MSATTTPYPQEPHPQELVRRMRLQHGLLEEYETARPTADRRR